MAVYILLAFIFVPIGEIALFMQVGDIIGFWPTLGLIILTAFIGTALLRWQGLSTLEKARQNLNDNILPVDELFTGICLLIAGVLLLLPGFLTDGIGLLLFVPGFRRFLKTLLARHIETITPAAPHSSGTGNPDRSHMVIDGEFEDITDPSRRDQ